MLQWVNLAHNSSNRYALVTTSINLQIPLNTGTSWLNEYYYFLKDYAPKSWLNLLDDLYNDSFAIALCDTTGKGTALKCWSQNPEHKEGISDGWRVRFKKLDVSIPRWEGRKCICLIGLICNFPTSGSSYFCLMGWTAEMPSHLSSWWKYAKCPKWVYFYILLFFLAINVGWNLKAKQSYR